MAKKNPSIHNYAEKLEKKTEGLNVLLHQETAEDIAIFLAEKKIKVKLFLNDEDEVVYGLYCPLDLYLISLGFDEPNVQEDIVDINYQTFSLTPAIKQFVKNVDAALDGKGKNKELYEKLFIRNK